MATEKLAGSFLTPSRKVKIPLKVRPIGESDIRPPSFGTWAAMGTLRLWEAILLSMNVEPSTRALKALKTFQLQKYKEYCRRLRIARAQLGLALQPYEDHANAGEGPANKVIALSDFIEYAMRQSWPEVHPVIEALSTASGGAEFRAQESRRESPRMVNSLLLLLHEFCSNHVTGFNINIPGLSGRAIEDHFLEETRKWRLPVDHQTLADYVKKMSDVVERFDVKEAARAGASDPLRIEDTKAQSS